MIEETSLKEYAALAQLAKANRRANGVLITLFIVIFFVAVFGMVQLYQSQQDAFKKRTAANNATQREVRTMVIESIRYQTCIGVVPIELRTPAAQRECFHKADLPGGLTEDDFITVPPEVKAVLAPSSSNTSLSASGSSSSSQGSTPATNPQSNNSQPPAETAPTPTAPQPPPKPVEVLGVPVCVPLTSVCITQGD
jgi:hypothetical protein